MWQMSRGEEEISVVGRFEEWWGQGVGDCDHWEFISKHFLRAYYTSGMNGAEEDQDGVQLQEVGNWGVKADATNAQIWEC